MSTPRSRPTGRTIVLVLVVLTLAAIVAVVGLWTLRDEPEPARRTDGPLPRSAGTLLEVEPLDSSPLPDSRAWRILYTTQRGGETVEASAAVYAPQDAALTDLPVLVWGHGTSGFARDCSPSAQADPMQAGSMYVGGEVLSRGWVLVAPDFPGIGPDGTQPYLIGEGAGRALLDAARAVQEMDDVDTSDRTAVWGFSQGGHAALWAGALEPTYAPELDLVGVTALAPATGLREAFDRLPAQDRLFAAYTMASYDEAYDDVDWSDYATAEGEAFGRDLAAECLAAPQDYADLAQRLMSFHDGQLFDQAFAGGAMGRRLAENEPPVAAVEAPLLIAQGSNDTVVPADQQAQVAAAACTAGKALEYLAVEGRDHLGLVLEDSPAYPDVFAWTDARFAGEPGPTECVRGAAGRG